MTRPAAPAAGTTERDRVLSEDVPTGDYFRSSARTRPSKPQPLTPDQQRHNLELLALSVSRRKAPRP